MRRCRAAASADDGCPRLGEFRAGLGEGFRAKPVPFGGKPPVGIHEYRQPFGLPQAPHGVDVGVRPHPAVGPDPRGPDGCGPGRGHLRRGAGHGAAVPVKGEAHDEGQARARLLDRHDGGLRLPEVEHRLHEEEIGSALPKALDLGQESRDGLVESQVADGLHEASHGADGTRH